MNHPQLLPLTAEPAVREISHINLSINSITLERTRAAWRTLQNYFSFRAFQMCHEVFAVIPLFHTFVPPPLGVGFTESLIDMFQAALYIIHAWIMDPSDSVHGIITWLCTLSLTPFTLFSRRIKRLAAEHKDYCSRRVRCLRSCTMFASSATFDFQNFSQIKLSCVVHRVKRKRTIPPLGPILWNSLAPVQRVPAWETWQVPSHQFPDQEVMGDPFFAYLGSPPVHLFNLCLPITGQTIPRPILYTVWSLSKQAGAHKGNFFSGRCSVYLE